MQQAKTNYKQQIIKTLKIAMKMKNNPLTKTNGHNLNGHKLTGFTIADIGDDHLYTGLETPMKSDAFKLTDDEKKLLKKLEADIKDHLKKDKNS